MSFICCFNLVFTVLQGSTFTIKAGSVRTIGVVQIHEIERLYYIESNCKALLLLHFQKPFIYMNSSLLTSQLYITTPRYHLTQEFRRSLSSHQNTYPPKIHNHHYITLPPFQFPPNSSPSTVPIPITASTHPLTRCNARSPSKSINFKEKKSNFVQQQQQQQHPSKSPIHISHP